MIRGRLLAGLLLASAALAACSGGEKSDPALNVARPEGAGRPAGPSAGGGGGTPTPGANAAASEAKL